MSGLTAAMRQMTESGSSFRRPSRTGGSKKLMASRSARPVRH